MNKNLSSIFIVMILAPFFHVSALGARCDDWKAPCPPPPMPERAPIRPTPLAQHQIYVNTIIEQENLPYLTIIGYDVKVAISPHVLKEFNLKSGQSVPAKLMYKIIEEDRKYWATHAK